MGTKLGQYFAEGNSMNVKLSHNKTNVCVFNKRSQMENVYKKVEPIIYCTKYVNTHNMPIKFVTFYSTLLDMCIKGLFTLL